MHQTIIDYCFKIKAKFPKHFQYINYLDFGSLDVNGNNNYLFDKLSSGMGIDIVSGDNVDIICKSHKLELNKQYQNRHEIRYTPGTIISTQMLEHDKYWKLSLINMHKLLRPGGLLLLTWAAPGFGRHSAYEGKYKLVEPEHYYELSENDFRTVLDCDKFFSEYEFELNKVQKDLCFWGIKK